MLDPLTGVTVTYSNSPVVMYRDDPAQAAFARNYIHVGPIQVNRSGNYQFFLWLGVWNNMQPVAAGSQRDGFDTVILFADGEPLSLELAGWTPEAIGTSEAVYLKPVASSTDAYYRVTADQIRLIAEATEFRIRTTGARPLEFQPWNSHASTLGNFREFINSISF